ncbi:MAG: FAD-dependent monooxygenase [Chromatiales bacterium]|jgi:2-polyprenyl-6-methoxyphenol hydroxylase-like FAD-dependent oxidoreductase|nr:FAD-dependent monooxygenase [Chromatiales bacterium]
MFDVAVVGAGPVGLVTALLLGEAGVNTVVLEADAVPSDDLRASTFHPPTLDMLAPYGVTAALMERGLVCPDWQIRMHATGERAVFDMSYLRDDTDYPFRLQCEQAELVRYLAARFERSGAVSVRFDQRVVGLTEHAQSVSVDIEGEEECVSARYVVGADGANSVVRQSLGLRFEGTTFPETMVLASTPFDFQARISGLSNVSYGWSAAGNFALLKLREFWRCSLHYDDNLSFDEALSEQRVQAQLQDIYPSVQPYTIIDKRPYRVHQRIVDDYRRGRMLLAGDSAHLNSPTGGMGMNGGIHDAFALADALVAVLDGAPDALLDRYTRQRRPVAEQEILAQAARNRQRMKEMDPAKRATMLRDLQAIADDRDRAREHLLRSSMITGLRAAAQVQ